MDYQIIVKASGLFAKRMTSILSVIFLLAACTPSHSSVFEPPLKASIKMANMFQTPELDNENQDFVFGRTENICMDLNGNDKRQITNSEYLQIQEFDPDLQP